MPEQNRPIADKNVAPATSLSDGLTPQGEIEPITDALAENLPPKVTITRSQWETGTSLGLLSWRSAELEAVADALDVGQKQNGDKSSLQGIWRAVNTWKAKDPDSKRNPEFVTALSEQIRNAGIEQDQYVTITRDQWVKETSLGWNYTRSAKLKAVDQALDDHHKQYESIASLARLEEASNDWIQDPSHGDDGPKRNPELVGKLLLQMRSARDYADQIANSQPDDVTGLETLQSAAHNAFRRLLINPASDPRSPTSRRIVHKDLSPEKKELADGMVQFVSAANSVRKGIQQPVNLIQSSKDNFRDAVGNAVSPGELFADASASAKFFEAVGAVCSNALAPAQLFAAIGLAFKQAYDTNNIENGRTAFRFDPKSGATQAFDALKQLMDRDAENKKVDIAKVAARVGASLVPVVGSALAPAITALAEITMRARILGLEREEMNRGNEVLAKEGFTPNELFEACPLLGCYYLAMADSSTLLNWMEVRDVYNPNFTELIKGLKITAEPAIQKAKDFIRQSSYALEGTEAFKGLDWYPKWKNNKIEYLSNVFRAQTVIKRLSEVWSRKGATSPDERAALRKANGDFMYEALRTFDTLPEEVLAETPGDRQPAADPPPGGSSGDVTVRNEKPEPKPEPWGDAGEALSHSTAMADHDIVPLNTGISRVPEPPPSGGQGHGGVSDPDKEDREKSEPEAPGGEFHGES